MTPTGTVIGGRYEIGTLVSRTTSAEVWRGHDQILDRTVAIKVVRDGDTPTGAGRLAVTGAVAVYDILVHEDFTVVVSEWVDAWPLDRILEQAVTLRPDDVVDIVDGAAGILDGAHNLGVPHGAVRPSNILLGDNGSVHLTDFRGRVDGSGQLDVTSDVAGLGRVLAELLSRCDSVSIPPHLVDLTRRLESGDPSQLPTLLEFRLTLRHPGGVTGGRQTSRWLIAIAALIATIAVASAASRILYGSDDGPEGAEAPLSGVEPGPSPTPPPPPPPPGSPPPGPL